MTTMYRVDYGTPHPVEVQAENPTYPNADSDGQRIFENTHFIDKARAWNRCLCEHLAGMKLSAARVEDLRNQLLKAEKECADAAVFYNQALNNHAEEGER